MHKGYDTVEYRRISITDSFFSHYADLISTAVLPYQWEVLNDRIEDAAKSHCLENFRIAAGRSTGKHYGVVFQDSDAYKWLEAVSYCIAGGRGDHFLEDAESVVELIAGAQQEDGYINTYYTIAEPEKRWSNLLEGHELYCAGHLIEAAVAYFQATGRKKLLDVSCRMADLICRTFGKGEGQIPGYPGHQEIELALMKLYRTTGDENYLNRARYFLEERGRKPSYLLKEIEDRGGEFLFPEFRNYDLKYSQAHMAPAEQTTMDGHAVRAMYMSAAMADLALEEKNGPFRRTTETLWRNVTEKRMYVTGGLGSSGFLERFTADYDLPNDRNYSETCASVGLMMFGQRMASLTGEARYYEGVERALYNTVLAGINADGEKYFYVNPLEVWPENCLPSTSLDHVKPVRQRWFDVACCPTNIARTLSSLGQYIFALEEDTLCIHLFISSEIDLKDSLGFSLKMDADLLGKGTVRLRADGPARLKIRIPSYGEDGTIERGDEEKPFAGEKDYYCLELKSGEEAVIRLNITPQWIAARGEVRENSGKAALAYGPFIYCLEEMDNGAILSEIFIDPRNPVSQEEPSDSLPGDIPRLSYEGYRLKNSVESLYGKPDWHWEPLKLKALPYCLWCNRTPGEMIVWQKVKL